MAGRRRGRYPPEYRERIVELTRAGRTPGSWAQEFEPSEGDNCPEEDADHQRDLFVILHSDHQEPGPLGELRVTPTRA